MNPSAWGGGISVRGKQTVFWLNGAAWIIDRDKCERLHSGDSTFSPIVAHVVYYTVRLLSVTSHLSSDWFVLFSCFMGTFVLHCHILLFNLLRSDHCFPPPLLFPSPIPLSLSLWQIPPCPASVVSTVTAHILDLEPSAPATADWLFVSMWKEPFSDVGLSGGASSHKHH